MKPLPLLISILSVLIIVTSTFDKPPPTVPTKPNPTSIDDFKSVVREVVSSIKSIQYSESMVAILTLTACQESHMGKLSGNVFQIERRTYFDLYRYLASHPEIRVDIERFTNPDELLIDRVKQLSTNLRYSIALACVYYNRVNKNLPHHDDIYALSRFWKKHYNTHRGKGTAIRALNTYYAMLSRSGYEKRNRNI